MSKIGKFDRTPYKDLDAEFLKPDSHIPALNPTKQALQSWIGNRGGIPESKRCYEHNNTDNWINYGASPYVFQTGNSTNDNPVTIEVEGDTFGVGEVNTASSTQRNWQLDYNESASGKVRFILWNGTTVAGDSRFETNNTFTGFKHVVITYDGSISSIKIYVDGIEEAFTQTDNNGGYTYDGASLGYTLTQNRLSDTVFQGGKISRFRIFNSVLANPDNIYYDFSLPSILFDKCDVEKGTTSFDSSGNLNNGSINGTLTSFYYEGSDVPYSFKNEIGFTERYDVFSTFNSFVDLGTTISSRLEPLDTWTLRFKFRLIGVPTGTTFLFFSGTGSTRRSSVLLTDAGGLDARITFAVGTSPDDAIEADISLNIWYTVEVTNTGGTITTSTIDQGASFVSSTTGSQGASITGTRIGATTGGSSSSGDFELEYLEIDESTENHRYSAANKWVDEISSIDGDLSNYISHWSRDESNTTKDILGNELNKKGKIKQLLKIVDVPVGVFNGTDNHVLIPDSSELQIGDGTNRPAFSIAARVNMDSANGFKIFAKGTGPAGVAYLLHTTATTKRLAIACVQEGSNYNTDRIAVTTTTDLTSFEGKEIYFRGTYDGGTDFTAFTLYAEFLNDDGEWEEIDLGDLIDQDLGTYTALKADINDSAIGLWNSFYADGKIHEVRLMSGTTVDDNAIINGEYLGNEIEHWVTNNNTGVIVIGLINNNHGEWQGTLGSQWGVDGEAIDYRLLTGYTNLELLEPLFNKSNDMALNNAIIYGNYSGTSTLTDNTGGVGVTANEITSDDGQTNVWHVDIADTIVEYNFVPLPNYLLLSIEYIIEIEYKIVSITGTISLSFSFGTGGNNAINIDKTADSIRKIHKETITSFSSNDQECSIQWRANGVGNDIEAYIYNIKLTPKYILPSSDGKLDILGGELLYKGIEKERFFPKLSSQLNFQYYKSLPDNLPTNYQVGDVLISDNILHSTTTKGIDKIVLGENIVINNLIHIYLNNEAKGAISATLSRMNSLTPSEKLAISYAVGTLELSREFQYIKELFKYKGLELKSNALTGWISKTISESSGTATFTKSQGLEKSTGVILASGYNPNTEGDTFADFLVMTKPNEDNPTGNSATIAGRDATDFVQHYNSDTPNIKGVLGSSATIMQDATETSMKAGKFYWLQNEGTTGKLFTDITQKDSRTTSGTLPDIELYILSRNNQGSNDLELNDIPIELTLIASVNLDKQKFIDVMNKFDKILNVS